MFLVQVVQISVVQCVLVSIEQVARRRVGPPQLGEQFLRCLM